MKNEIEIELVLVYVLIFIYLFLLIEIIQIIDGVRLGSDRIGLVRLS